jgi:hypothetical protein
LISRGTETTEVLFARYGPRYRWLVATTVLLGTISATVTTTTVNVAIPDIMGAYGIGQDRAQWLSTGALAGTTIAMLLSAWMVHSFGTRKTFIGALFVFVTALVLAGTSPNDSVLIVCRIAQGAVTGLMQPLAIYTLFRVFPHDQRGKAMGFFGLSVILGPAMGPTGRGLSDRALQLALGVLHPDSDQHRGDHARQPLDAGTRRDGSARELRLDRLHAAVRGDRLPVDRPLERAARRLVVGLRVDVAESGAQRRRRIRLLGAARRQAARRAAGALQHSVRIRRAGCVYFRRGPVRLGLSRAALRADRAGLQPAGSGARADAGGPGPRRGAADRRLPDRSPARTLADHDRARVFRAVVVVDGRRRRQHAILDFRVVARARAASASGLSILRSTSGVCALCRRNCWDRARA